MPTHLDAYLDFFKNQVQTFQIPKLKILTTYLKSTLFIKIYDDSL